MPEYAKTRLLQYAWQTSFVMSLELVDAAESALPWPSILSAKQVFVGWTAALVEDVALTDVAKLSPDVVLG